MNSIKRVGLTTIATVAAILGGVSSATAESTSVCKLDESPCLSSNLVKHMHGATQTPDIFLNGLGNVTCDILSLGDANVLAAPEEVTGTATFTNCGRKKLFGGEESCTVIEVNGPAIGTVLREGHETAKVVGKGEVEVHCGSIIQCVYSSENIVGTAKGPLLSTASTGEVWVFGQTLRRVGGTFCPETAKLDGTVVSLEAIYLSS